METKRDLLNHFKMLRESLNVVGGSARLNIETFEVEVKISSSIYTLYPQFLKFLGAKKDAGSEFSTDVICFSGWRPNRTVVAHDVENRLTFKTLLKKLGFPTPAYSLNPRTIRGPVVVRESARSIHEKIRGPFASPADAWVNHIDGEFLERYVPGELITTWFWNATPVVSEIRRMPTVIGDGCSTIRDLATEEAMNPNRTIDWNKLSNVIGFYGRTLDTVLSPEEMQIIDLGSEPNFSRPRNVYELTLPAHDPTFAVLDAIGKSLSKELLLEDESRALYSVEGLVDYKKQISFLSINFDPVTHPALYPLIVENLPRTGDTRSPQHSTASARLN